MAKKPFGGKEKEEAKMGNPFAKFSKKGSKAKKFARGGGVEARGKTRGKIV